MKKPNLSRVWETYVEIPSNNEMGYSSFLINAYGILRLKVRPMISDLTQNGTEWYCFLFHPSRIQNDRKRYWHIRFEPREGIDDKDEVNAILPDFCDKTMTVRCKDVEDINHISGIDESLIKNNEIEEAWRILGEQSEWFLNMLEIHKENVTISSRQIGQFLHFFFNMSQALFVCPCCRNVLNGGNLIVFEP